MATNDARILVGAGVVSIGDWVTAGGSGSLVDVGHTKEPVTLGAAFEDFEVTSERAITTVKRVPIKADLTLVVPMLEMSGEHWRMAFRQPAANLTGTAPLETLLIGNQVEQYHQIEVVGPAVDTANERTFTFWKGFVISIAEVPIAKADTQVLSVTFGLLYDSSVATADKIGKWVEAVIP